MRKTLLFVVAMASLGVGVGVQAHAADWVPPKIPDPLPDSLTWYGITFYATLDHGYARITRSTSTSTSMPASPGPA